MLDNQYNGKYDKTSGVGASFNLHEQKVYKITPDINGVFADENKNIIARRQFIPLKVDKVYKTQFFNEQLKNAILPLTESTRIIYYDKNGEVNELQFLPTLSQEYSSIICKIQPVNELLYVSVVIYCGPELENILLSDGSTKMDSVYIPTDPKDIVTKDYADDLIEDFTSATAPLKNFSIKQCDLAPVKKFSYTDNSLYDILFVRDFKTKAEVADCVLTIDPFVINNNYDIETTKIGLFISGTTTQIVFVKDILENKTENWTLLTTEDIYPTVVNKFYWKNSYQLKFNLKNYESKLDPNSPYINIAIRVWDEKNLNISEVKLFGLDEYIKSAEPENVKINYIEENLKKFKTKYISGVPYFPYSGKIYTLPLTIEIPNNFLQYFKSKENIKLLVLDENKEIDYSYNLSVDSYTPTSGKFIFNQKINFSIKDKYLAIQASNVLDEIVYTYYQPFDTATDSSDESNRVTTCSSLDVTPDQGYGDVWDSTKELSEWDLKLSNSIYTTLPTTKNSAICFAITPKDCYSHIRIDIEHDGQMYILSEGNTGWLNCQKLSAPFSIPKKHDNGCKVNENYYTFNKVNYKSKVFIRIINATRVKFNSAILG